MITRTIEIRDRRDHPKIDLARFQQSRTFRRRIETHADQIRPTVESVHQRPNVQVIDGAKASHTSYRPFLSTGVANAALNSFGLAFKNNGSRWDPNLAAQRSDNDNCSNGFELGDENGDGRADQGVTRERSNPGQSDCTLQLNDKAWTALKTLFK